MNTIWLLGFGFGLGYTVRSVIAMRDHRILSKALDRLGKALGDEQKE